MPVLFADAIRRAAAQGAGVFIEIGPRAVLRSYLDQTLRAASATYAIVPTFSRQDKASVDALATTFATAITRGARFDVTRAFGPPPASGWRHLPHYAWQRTHHLTPDTVEATGGIETTLSGTTADGLLGYRAAVDVMVWHSHLDTAVCPELGDHCVAGKPWLPAAAFADMALSAAQVWLGHDRVELRDFDISRPLVLSNETAMDVRTSIDPETATCEIASRQRQSDDVWQVHVRCRVAALTGGDKSAPAAISNRADGRAIPAADVYALASDVGLDYGPAFRRLSGVTATADGELHVAFDSGVGPLAARLRAVADRSRRRLPRSLLAAGQRRRCLRRQGVHSRPSRPRPGLSSLGDRRPRGDLRRACDAARSALQSSCCSMRMVKSSRRSRRHASSPLPSRPIATPIASPIISPASAISTRSARRAISPIRNRSVQRSQASLLRRRRRARKPCCSSTQPRSGSPMTCSPSMPTRTGTSTPRRRTARSPRRWRLPARPPSPRRWTTASSSFPTVRSRRSTRSFRRSSPITPISAPSVPSSPMRRRRSRNPASMTPMAALR